MEKDKRMTVRRVISRKSLLARTQTTWVMEQLASAYPEQVFTLETIDTQGDKHIDQPLSQLGGKGLFTEALEQALLNKTADLAVHSLKDLPKALPDGLMIAAIPKRLNPCDAFVSLRYPSLSALPHGATLGTASLRRQAQVKRIRPDIAVQCLRGNVDTRLQKLADGSVDAILLASAGLERLNRMEVIRERLAVSDFLPAVGQGALAIECRTSDTSLRQMLQVIHDPETAQLVGIERAFNATLGGSCQTPIGALAERRGDTICLSGIVLSEDGQTVIQGNLSLPIHDADQLGKTLAYQLLEQGAGALLPPP